MLVLPKAVALRIISAGALSVGLRLAVSPGATRSYSHFPRQTTRSVRNMSTSLDEGPGTSGGTSGAQNEGLREKKKTMRKHIKSDLKAMSEAAVDAGSAAVAERLLACPQLQERSSGEGVEGGGGAVSVYLSMPGELGTAAIVSGLFKLGKKVYIPKVLGAGSADMRMFPVRSEEEIASFDLTKWKIPEPSEDLALSREDGVTEGDIDVVVVPAVAFDPSCNRLGHGRGHYDCFFERVNKASKAKGRPPPIKMGVCFDEQVVDCVPTESLDVPLDFVLTPTRTFRREPEVGGTEKAP